MTISAKVRSIYSLEIENLDEYVPEDSDLFSVPIRVIVGPSGLDGEESFDIVVCSPEWLKIQCRKDGFVLGRHLLIVEHFEIGAVRSIITKSIESISGNSWKEVAIAVSRIGYWEFEGYHEAGSAQS